MPTPAPITWFLDEATLLHRLQASGFLCRATGDLLTLHTVVLPGGEIVFARVVQESTAQTWMETLRLALDASGSQPRPHTVATDRGRAFSSVDFQDFLYLELLVDHRVRTSVGGAHAAERAVLRLRQHLDHQLSRVVLPTLALVAEEVPILVASLNPQPVEA
ncbi:MAG TPA: hypothetical protein VF615_25695 [Longimicrobiaceae bacterium]|jgi:hypothetical protein